MTPNDVFLLVVRWVHLTASVAWVGGGIFYLFVLRPALHKSENEGREVNRLTADEFRVLVDVCFFVLVVTGISLTFDRLSDGVTGPAYAIVLGVKVALSIWMFFLARSHRRRTAILEEYRRQQEPPTGTFAKTVRALSGYNMVVVLGVLVFLLADLLKFLYEAAIR